MNDQNNPDFKALNLGAKLTCGFEILANTKTHQDDLKQSYIQSLTNKGYFQSELKGSKKYNGLLAEAEKHLLQNSSGKYKGHIISKCPFGVFKSPQKQRNFSRISALASKNRPNQENKRTLYR